MWAEWDQICDRFAILGQFAPPAQIQRELDCAYPSWVAELGVREGDWMKRVAMRGNR